LRAGFGGASMSVTSFVAIFVAAFRWAVPAFTSVRNQELPRLRTMLPPVRPD
jgi:hypothetical protein